MGFFDVFIEHSAYFSLKLSGTTVTDAVQINGIKNNIFSNVKEFNLNFKSLYLNHTANYMRRKQEEDALNLPLEEAPTSLY